jgi:hypothetical protein
VKHKNLLKTDTYIELGDVQEILDVKRHRNFLYDYNGSDIHYYKWCESKGYKRDGSSKVLYAEYKNDPQGEAARPESLNLFSYLADQCILEGVDVYMELPDYLETSKDVPAWVKDIYIMIKSEFGHLFPNNEVKIKVLG